LSHSVLLQGAFIDDAFIFFKLRDSSLSKKIDEEFKDMNQKDLMPALQKLINNKKQLIEN